MNGIRRTAKVTNRKERKSANKVVFSLCFTLMLAEKHGNRRLDTTLQAAVRAQRKGTAICCRCFRVSDPASNDRGVRFVPPLSADGGELHTFLPLQN